MTVSMVCAHMYVHAHVKSVSFFETDSLADLLGKI